MKTCKSLFSQAKGLMFSKRKNLMFVFDKEKIISIHTWFVFFPIDVVFLDKDMKLVESVENLKPFRFYKSKNKAKYMIEIADKEIKEEFLPQIKK